MRVHDVFSHTPLTAKSAARQRDAGLPDVFRCPASYAARLFVHFVVAHPLTMEF